MCTHSVKVENDLHIFKYKNVSYSEYILIAWILLLFFLPLMWLSVLEELFGGMELSEIFLCAKSFIQLCLTLCNPVVARQAPLSMGFSRQKYWSGLPSLLQGIFLTQGLNPGLLHCRQILYRLSHQGSSWCLVFFNSNPLMFQLPDLGCKNSYISCPAPLSHHALSLWSCISESPEMLCPTFKASILPTK